MSKIFLKALKSYRENNGTPELKDLKELIETNLGESQEKNDTLNNLKILQFSCKNYAARRRKFENTGLNEQTL